MKKLLQLKTLAILLIMIAGTVVSCKGNDKSMEEMNSTTEMDTTMMPVETVPVETMPGDTATIDETMNTMPSASATPAP